MKIVILANSSSGLYAFRKELIEELVRSNEVISITPNTGWWKELEELGNSMIEIEINRRGINPFTDIRLLWDYFRVLKKIKPELVITYTIKPNIYGGMICRLLHIPYANNITGLGTAFERGGFLKKLVTFMYRSACKKAKVIFFENSANRDVFVANRIALLEQTYVLNGAGVNLKNFYVTEYPKGEVTRFLFIGRVMAEKGIDELFEAMKLLIGDGEKVELHVLGGYEEDYRKVIEKYEKEGWLFYHGFQKDVRPFIEQAHCFVLPSWHEGMANTNLECAASGRPIITSDIPGCREAVIDGSSGYLVNVKCVEDLYRAMHQFAELTFEERERMGLRGRMHIETIFDKKAVVEDTIKGLYK